MYMNRIFLCVAVFVIVAVTMSESYAQRTGTTGTTGSTSNTSNSRTSGGGGGGGNNAGGVAAGTYVQDFSFDSVAPLSSGMGNTGNNRSGNTGNNRTGNAGNNFIGSSGNTFIGSSGTGTTGNRNTTARTTNMGAANRNRATNANQMQGRMGGGNASNNRTQVQPVITLGFPAPKADYVAVSTALSRRIEQNAQTGRIGAVRIELADGVAVANGTVAGEYDKKVAENMLRLQPGVSEIDSNIQIDTSAPPQNLLSPSAKRRQQTVNVDDAITPQGRPLVYVF